MTRVVCIFVLLALLSGCFSIDATKLPKTNEHHLLVGNYGWYLFDCIPLICGNATENSFSPWVIFRDDVEMRKIQHRFVQAKKDMGGGEIKNMTFISDDSVMLEIPGLPIPLPLPYILCYHEIQLSGVFSADDEADFLEGEAE